jgi:hypothetical protein
MNSYRTSIAGLLGVVAFVALWLATIRSGSSYYTAIAGALALAALLSAVGGAIVLRGRSRAFCVGFALFGIGFSVELHQDLLGWRVGKVLNENLDRLATKLLPPLIEPLDRDMQAQPALTEMPSLPGLGIEEKSDPANSRAAVPLLEIPPEAPPPPELDLTGGPKRDDVRLRRLMVLNEFVRIGSMTFSLLMGVVGGLITVAMYTRAQNEPTSARSPKPVAGGS